jgi:hypothetical protein
MSIVHPAVTGTAESRLLFIETPPERTTAQSEQPVTPSEGGNLYQNRFLHAEVEDAKKILEGKYAQNPSKETAQKLALYERLFDEQFKQFKQGGQHTALGEMHKLTEEMWDFLTRSPRMRLLTRGNRFDDAKTQKEIQELRENRNWLRNSPETIHVETMYRLLGAREASDDTIMSKVKEFNSHPEYVDWLRAALGPKERDDLRSTLIWHMENRPALSDDAKKNLQKLVRLIF